jgi:hypothetical protein
MAYANLASASKKNRAEQINVDIGTNGFMNFFTGTKPPSPDFIPSGYLLVSLPLSTTAGVSSLAVLSGYVDAAGTGGTDGVYTMTITGGSGIGATGTYTVFGGVLSNISITAVGSGYVTPPTLGGFGISGLSGASATAVMTGILVFNNITSATSIASGTATFARVVTNSGVGVIDMDVGSSNAFSVVMDNTFIPSSTLISITADILLEA